MERLLRALYGIALVVLLPVTLYHLVWRGFRQRAYLSRWSERYARYAAPVAPTPLWIHAVSVGEVNAAVPLVNALRARFPDTRMLITTITPTGSARVRALWGDAVEHVYLPYDLSGAVSRFLRQFQPRIALVMETELWPNLLFGCRDAGVPMYILNARLSARSLRGYQVLAPLVSRALHTVRGVCAQSQADARRFVRLGAQSDRVHDTGNLKYDVAPVAGAEALVTRMRARAGPRPSWIAASTHPDEEAIVLQVHRQLRDRFPGLLLYWAPRHPERFRAVVEQVRGSGLSVRTRAQGTWPDARCDVFVIDTLGELATLLAVADVAFVGGSLQPIGGHNLLEPAAVGVPVVTGPHLHNFSDIARGMREADALRVVEDADGLCDAVAELLASPEHRARMADSGRALVASGRGALARMLTVMDADLQAATSG